LGPFADDYRTHLVAVGYAFGSLQHLLTQFGEVSRWLDSEGLLAAQLNEVQAQRFAAFRRARAGDLDIARKRAALLAFLRSISVVAERAEAEDPSRSFSVLSLLPVQREGARRQDRRGTSRCRPPLLSRRRKGAADLAGLRGSDVTRTVDDLQTTELALGEGTVVAVKSLLAYLHVTAIIPVSLIPRFRRWRDHEDAINRPSCRPRKWPACSRAATPQRRRAARLRHLDAARPSRASACEVVALMLDTSTGTTARSSSGEGEPPRTPAAAV